MAEHSFVSFFFNIRKMIYFFCQYEPIDCFISLAHTTIIEKQNFIPQDFIERIIAPNFQKELNERLFKT